MTPRSELDRLFAESLADIEKPHPVQPESTDCTGVITGNADLRSEWNPHPDNDRSTNTLPIYPKPEDKAG